MAKLRKENGIQSKARRRFVPHTTDGRHTHPVAANTLNREFYLDTAWVAEIVKSQTTMRWSECRVPRATTFTTRNAPLTQT